MFVANTGMLAMNFNEEGINTSGSLTKSLRRPSEFTFQREQAAKDIVQIAKRNNEPIGIVISKVISQSIPELQSFVQARGETPSTDPKRLAIQAALLRATEIGMVAKTLDTDDDDALYKIEDSEQQHLEDNSGENASILPPSTAGALYLLVDRIKSRHKTNGRSGALRDFAVDIKASTGVSNFNNVCCGQLVNNATGDEYLDEYEANYGPIGGDSGGSFWDNLFGNIDKIVDGITKTAGAVNTTVGNVKTTTGGILDQVNNIGGGIGAASIQQYLAANWWKVLLFAIGLILFTLLLSRATSRK